MKTNRYILITSGYGDKPMVLKKRTEIIKIDFFRKRFTCEGHEYKMNKLKYYRDGGFQLEYFGRDTDFCIKPKWYQYTEILFFYYIRILFKDIFKTLKKIILFLFRILIN